MSGNARSRTASEIGMNVLASVDDGTDADTLDDLKTDAMRRAEAAGYRLRNKLKYGKPGGDADGVCDLCEGRMLLPWPRPFLY